MPARAPKDRAGVVIFIKYSSAIDVEVFAQMVGVCGKKEVYSDHIASTTCCYSRKIVLLNSC